MCKSAGVTLVELLTTLTVLVVLATVAAPTFTSLRLDARRTTAVNGFVHSVFLARSESIKRGEIVTVCRSSDGQQCNPVAGDWSTGWIVFVNLDRDDPPLRDPAEPLIIGVAGPAGTRITSNRASYSFRPATQGVVNGTLVVCDTRGSAHARAVIISHTGRPRVAQRDSEGKPLRCAPG
ncbi:MAG TPA: GspH/FimT family protein [Steroidobacteraceae bacterium]|nr:GspH/FimT family protein [Steroidobacteraceae bacterium]